MVARSAPPLPEQPTLRALLRQTDLQLTLVTPAETLPEGALDRALRWVHSSDLADPTPFLADDLALLTTGTQLVGQSAVSPSDYVHRLAARGVVGLGFGREVALPDVPAPLVEACTDAGIPLFEVPYRTPFIAVARAHAESIAAHAFGRRNWALETQRALALAALRPHGLESTLAELARRLDAWIGMVDAAGVLASEHPRRALPPETEAELVARATEILARGQQAGQSLTLGDQAFTLFSLGRDRHLRGVIAIAAGALDPEARAVVTSVIAMAGLALDQGEDLLRQRRRLHAQVLSSLQLDDPGLARRVLGSVPPAPFVVAVADPDAPADSLSQWWERVSEPREAFTAESDAGYTMCVTADREELVDEAAARFGIRIGVSSPARYDEFSRAHAEALAALRRGGTGATRFADTEAASLLRALATEDAQLAASARLAPLRDHDAAGGDLERSLRVWLTHDARLEPAAAELGIHRHTLRTRVTQASRLLELDLGGFPGRAELWAALQTAPPR